MKNVIITGTSRGIGFETAKFIANLKPKKIVFACRSEERANDAINQIDSELGPLEIEFSNLRSVELFDVD